MTQDHKEMPRECKIDWQPDCSEYDKLKAENKRLRKALRFYADPKEWSRRVYDQSHWELLFNSTERDGHGYEVAREALEEVGEDATRGYDRPKLPNSGLLINKV